MNSSAVGKFCCEIPDPQSTHFTDEQLYYKNPPESPVLGRFEDDSVDSGPSRNQSSQFDQLMEDKHDESDFGDTIPPSPMSQRQSIIPTLQDSYFDWRRDLDDDHRPELPSTPPMKKDSERIK